VCKSVSVCESVCVSECVCTYLLQPISAYIIYYNVCSYVDWYYK